MILDKDVLVNNILTELSDNSTGQISPYDIRHNLLDIIDSVHLLTTGKPLNGSNFGTPFLQNTRAGEDALAKLHLAGYYSIDNTAIGYSALKSNYQSVKNTAIGSHALFCNVYGEHNAALGYSALGGNTVGIGNVGLGNYTLNNNKGGNFNIAIGHGAGYYLTNNVSNKLFIGSHPIDSGYICENPFGSGLTPLVYGDMSLLRLGIAVTGLHSDGALQVGGHVSPSGSNTYNLGSSNYYWKNLYLGDKLIFDSNLYVAKKTSSVIEVKGDLLPQSDKTYTLGSTDYLWQSGYFNNIYVSGLATINRYVALDNCHFYCKTLTLAASGSVSLDGGGPDTLYDYSDQQSPQTSSCGYLTDQDLSGAGFSIESSGVGYQRSYSLIFTPSDASLTCLQSDNAYSRSSWNSNISIHIASGSHLRTDRVIFPSSINIVNSSGCFGLFSRGSGIFFSKSELVSHNQHPSGYLGGVGNVNFYSTSGNFSNYVVNFASPESGVTISHRLLTGIKNKSPDILNNNLDKLRGFEFQYIDDANGYSLGPTSDRLIIGSYNNTSDLVNALTIMKSNSNEAIVGITNLTPYTKNTLPVTSLNVRSSTNAVGRFTSENQGSTRSAIQLLGTYNCLYDGFEAAYLNGSGLADLSMYKESGKSVFLRFYENNTLGLFTSSGTSNEMFTIGDNFYNDAVISMYQNQTNITATSGYGKLYIKQKIRQNQSQSVYLLDGSGNTHDLVMNPLDTIDGRCLYIDSSGNTFGGRFCPDNRHDLVNTSGNTAIGQRALFQLTNGNYNSIFGSNAATGISTGNENVVYGANSANEITTGSKNIVIGSFTFSNASSSSSNNIIIGHSGVGDHIGSPANYRFVVGHSSGIVLLDGVIGPNNTNKYLSMPKGGKFLVNDSNDTDSLQIRANYIDVIDRGGNAYPNNTLTFSFIGNNSADLLSLNHAAEPMNNTALYSSPTPSRPYAQLQGDLRLRGAIRFSDSTSLSSAAFLQNITILSSGLNTLNNSVNYISQSFVEGYVNTQIDAPTIGSSPTSGILYTKNQSWIDNGQITLVNRDRTTVIHSGAYVVAMRVNNEYRPMWISASDTKCQCCR